MQNRLPADPVLPPKGESSELQLGASAGDDDHDESDNDDEDDGNDDESHGNDDDDL